MKKSPVFFECCDGAALVQLIHGSEAELAQCLGGSFKKIETLMTEGAGEKHLPAVECNGSEITVRVGSVPHPMTAEHSIGWVYLQTEKGGQCMKLEPVEEPKACFAVAQGDKAVAVYAYCNLHGLWKVEL